jgi:LEA14-like dessication related protein
LKPPGRIILVIAILGLLGMMGGGVYYASLDNPKLEQAIVELSAVELRDVNTIENRATMTVTFLVTNPSDLTFTIPLIAYELYGDGVSLGSASYSTQDVAMPGRAAFYPDTEIPLKSKFSFVLTDVNETVYEKIVTGQSIQYSAQGMVTVESAWSIVEMNFDTSS